MPAQCTLPKLELERHQSRRVEVEFDGGIVSSDGGLLITRELLLETGLMGRLAACFMDYRDPCRSEFSVEELLTQRIVGLLHGYEDIDDHDRLRHDPLLALAVGREDVLGESRIRAARDGRVPLAGKSTLNRLERAADARTANPRYHKIVVDRNKMDDLLLDVFLEYHERPAGPLVIDLDPSDLQLHGNQEGRFYHGYYGHHCYLPLYIFIGEWPVCVRLQKADRDGAGACIEELDYIVGRLREAWPDVQVIVRGDSGFARDEILAWCEDNTIDYVIGMARNERLQKMVAREIAAMQAVVDETGKPARTFKNLRYRTRESWTRKRRVVAKAEVLVGKANPRFVVTSLKVRQAEARWLYEDLYCARGQMENHIKEQQLELFGGRVSASTMNANALRLYFSAFAHLLAVLLRHRALRHTPLARATAGTIRAKLLKVGAIVRVSVRRIHITLSQAYPGAHVFRRVLTNLRGPPHRPLVA